MKHTGIAIDETARGSVCQGNDSVMFSIQELPTDSIPAFTDDFLAEEREDLPVQERIWLTGEE